MTVSGTARIARHLEHIVGERHDVFSPGKLRAARDYIGAQFAALGSGVEMQEVPYGGRTAHNVLWWHGGVENRCYFVLAAHYDTVAGSPGADDNASAVAALLEIAHCLRPLTLRTALLFAAFTLEEQGFVGSRHFLRQALARQDGIAGMMSMEMVGYRDRRPGSQRYPPYVDASRYPAAGDFIAVVGNEPSGALAASATAAMRSAAPGLGVETLVVPGNGEAFPEVRLSDHSPFWEQGIPAVMLTDTAFFRNPHYHQATDTAATLDMDFIRDVCAGVCGFLTQYLR